MANTRDCILVFWLTGLLSTNAWAVVPGGPELTHRRPDTPKGTQASVFNRSMDDRAQLQTGAAPAPGRFLGLRKFRHAAGRSLGAHGTAALEAEARAHFREVAGDAASDGLWLVNRVPFGRQTALHFEQRVDGVRLHNVQAVAVFNSRGLIYAHHNLVPPPTLDTQPRIPETNAEPAAVTYAEALVAGATATGDSELVIVFVATLPRLAWSVTIASVLQIPTLLVFVDAHSGEALAEQPLYVHGVEGTVRFAVEPLCQGDTPKLEAIPHVQWSSGEYTDAQGDFSSSSAVAQASVAMTNPYFDILEDDGSALAGPWTYPLQAKPAHNDLEITNAPMSQIDPLRNLLKVRAWLLSRVNGTNAQTDKANKKLPVKINLPYFPSPYGPMPCNAMYSWNPSNGDEYIAFTDEYSSGGTSCVNTGRVAKIAYHEYGHRIHFSSGGPSVPHAAASQVSEGIADYIASTITNEPEMGGIPTCHDVFRSCDNTKTYCQSGCDYGPNTNDPHVAGLPLCAAFWTLRDLLSDRYGFDQGVATADRILLRFLTRVGDMSSAYDAVIASDDDSDSDPSNGTTHSCEINEAFANDDPGGVNRFPDAQTVAGSPAIAVNHEPPGTVSATANADVTLSFDIEVDPGCAGDSADGEPETILVYTVDDGDEEELTLTLPAGVDQTDGTTLYQASATLPALTAPASVSYYLRLSIANHTTVYPYQGEAGNPNDSGWPFYRHRLYYGDQSPIYANDLEAGIDQLNLYSDECEETSDWECGTPSGAAGGPSTAPSGDKVCGTNLTGQYSAGRKNYLELPPQDLGHHLSVRLQFWRFVHSADTAVIRTKGCRTDASFTNIYPIGSKKFDWQDPMWFFEDIDLPDCVGKSNVEVQFVMSDSDDDGKQLAGFYVDDLRLVGESSLPPPGQADSTTADLRLIGSCAATGANSAGWLIALLGLAALCRARRRSREVR